MTNFGNEGLSPAIEPNIQKTVKIEIGHDYMDKLSNEDKENLFGKIGGYCLIDDREKHEVKIQGSNLIIMNRMFEPTVHFSVMTGESLKFMHDDFNLEMDKTYYVVKMPILRDAYDRVIDNDPDKAFLSYWVFNTFDEAMEMLSFLSDILNRVTITNTD